MERHVKVLENLIEETHQLKVKIQQLRIEKEDPAEALREWSHGIEAEAASYETVIDKLKESINSELNKVKTKEEKIEQEKQRQLFEEELKFEETKLELKQEYEKKLEEARSKSVTSSAIRCPS